MSSLSKKIAEIEEELSRTQRNKATEKHVANLRAKLSDLRRQSQRHKVAAERKATHRTATATQFADKHGASMSSLGGFGGYSGSERVAHTAQFAALGGTATEFDLDFVDASGDGEVDVCLRRLGKKDAKTKLRALSELTRTLSMRKAKGLRKVAPGVITMFRRLAWDNDDRVRTAVYGPFGVWLAGIGRHAAPHLNDVFVHWWSHRCDPSPEVAQAANQVLDEVFPDAPSSNDDGSRRRNLLRFVRRGYLRELRRVVLASPQTLSPPNASPQERKQRYERVVSSALKGLAEFVADSDEVQSAVQTYGEEEENMAASLVDWVDSELRSLATCKYVRVRASMYDLVSALCRCCARVINTDDRLAKFAPLVFGALADSAPQCQPSLWRMQVTLLRVCPTAFEFVPFQEVAQRLTKLVSGSIRGRHGALVLQCLLPFVVHARVPEARDSKFVRHMLTLVWPRGRASVASSDAAVRCFCELCFFWAQHAAEHEDAELGEAVRAEFWSRFEAVPVRAALFRVLRELLPRQSDEAAVRLLGLRTRALAELRGHVALAAATDSDHSDRSSDLTSDHASDHTDHTDHTDRSSDRERHVRKKLTALLLPALLLREQSGQVEEDAKEAVRIFTDLVLHTSEDRAELREALKTVVCAWQRPSRLLSADGSHLAEVLVSGDVWSFASPQQTADRIEMLAHVLRERTDVVWRLLPRLSTWPLSPLARLLTALARQGEPSEGEELLRQEQLMQRLLRRAATAEAHAFARAVRALLLLLPHPLRVDCATILVDTLRAAAVENDVSTALCAARCLAEMDEALFSDELAERAVQAAFEAGAAESDEAAAALLLSESSESESLGVVTDGGATTETDDDHSDTDGDAAITQTITQVTTDGAITQAITQAISGSDGAERRDLRRVVNRFAQVSLRPLVTQLRHSMTESVMSLDAWCRQLHLLPSHLAEALLPSHDDAVALLMQSPQQRLPEALRSFLRRVAAAATHFGRVACVNANEERRRAVLPLAALDVCHGDGHVVTVLADGVARVVTEDDTTDTEGDTQGDTDGRANRLLCTAVDVALDVPRLCGARWVDMSGWLCAALQRVVCGRRERLLRHWLLRFERRDTDTDGVTDGVTDDTDGVTDDTDGVTDDTDGVTDDTDGVTDTSYGDGDANGAAHEAVFASVVTVLLSPVQACDAVSSDLLSALFLHLFYLLEQHFATVAAAPSLRAVAALIAVLYRHVCLSDRDTDRDGVTDGVTDGEEELRDTAALAAHNTLHTVTRALSDAALRRALDLQPAARNLLIAQLISLYHVSGDEDDERHGVLVDAARDFASAGLRHECDAAQWEAALRLATALLLHTRDDPAEEDEVLCEAVCDFLRRESVQRVLITDSSDRGDGDHSDRSDGDHSDRSDGDHSELARALSHALRQVSERRHVALPVLIPLLDGAVDRSLRVATVSATVRSLEHVLTERSLSDGSDGATDGASRTVQEESGGVPACLLPLLARPRVLAWHALLAALSACEAERRAPLVRALRKRHFALLDTVLRTCVTRLRHAGVSAEALSDPVSVTDTVSDTCQLDQVATRVMAQLLTLLPGLVRAWWMSLSERVMSDATHRLVTRDFAAVVGSHEIRTARTRVDDGEESFTVTGSRERRELKAVLERVDSEIKLVMRVKLPRDYPLQSADVNMDASQCSGASRKMQRQWVLHVVATLNRHCGSVSDALQRWRQAVGATFAGVEECPICYFVVHAASGSLPSKKCRTCRNIFHPECLYKWFKSAGKSTCPTCRSEF